MLLWLGPLRSEPPSDDCRGIAPAWAAHYEQDNERICRAFDTSVPATSEGVRNVTCRLAVINAGSPRAGSTLLQQIIDDAVVRVRLRFKRIEIINAAYWRFDRHLLSNPRYYELIGKWWGPRNRSWVPPRDEKVDVLVAKSHEFDSELAGLCEQSLVVASSREPDRMAESAAAAGFFGGGPLACATVGSYLAGWEHAMRCWLAHSTHSLRFAYRDLAAAPALAATQVFAELALILAPRQAGEMPLSELAKALMVKKDYARHEANVRIPGAHKKKLQQQGPVVASGAGLLPKQCDAERLRACFPSFSGLGHALAAPRRRDDPSPQLPSWPPWVPA